MGRRQENGKTWSDHEDSSKKTSSKPRATQRSQRSAIRRASSQTHQHSTTAGLQVLDLEGIADGISSVEEAPASSSSVVNSNRSSRSRGRRRGGLALEEESSTCSSGAAQPMPPPRRRRSDNIMDRDDDGGGGGGGGDRGEQEAHKEHVDDALSTTTQSQHHSSLVSRTASEREGLRTLDLVLEKRYYAAEYSTGRDYFDDEQQQQQQQQHHYKLQPPNFKEIEHGDSNKAFMLEASTGVLVDDLLSGNILHRWGMRSWPATTATRTGPGRDNGAGTLRSDHDEKEMAQLLQRRENMMAARSDSNSTMMPEPPSLHQTGHYTIPGAFRMTSGGFLRGAAAADYSNDPDVQSFIGSVTSYYPTTGVEIHRSHNDAVNESPAIVEASLVNDEDDDHASSPMDACSPLPASAFDVSMGGDTSSMAHNTYFNSETPTKASPIFEALPMDEIQTVKAFFSTRKVKCFLLFLAGVFVILALGTAYGVTGFKQKKSLASNANATSLDDETPTNPPTTEGDLDLIHFTQVAIPDYTRAALLQQNSPQSKALSWLRNNTLLAGYSISRRMQRFALATFFFSTGGDRRWTNNTGWLSDDDECTWFFSSEQLVEGGDWRPCDENNSLTSFSLAENNMRGTFPLEISFLSSLEVLEMPRNILTGFLPTTLGDMKLLRSVELFDNFLSGVVPDEIGEASSLEILNVEYNLMAQILPETLGKLSNLKRLLLDRNLFRGNIQSEFGHLSNLETFYLFKNAFSGTIPSEVGYMTSLQSIQWEDNQLSGGIPSEIGLLENLVDFSIGNNTLTGTIPSEIGSLTRLTYCDLFWNFLSGTVPTEMGRLTNVERMYFEHNRLEGPIPSQMGNMQSINRLWLYGNALTGTLPSEFGQLSDNLNNLDLSFNDLTGELPSEIGKLTNLESLSLEYNSFSGRIPTELGRLTRLSLLTLHGNLFTGIVPFEICFQRLFGILANVVVDCSMVVCDCCICSSDLN